MIRKHKRKNVNSVSSKTNFGRTTSGKITASKRSDKRAIMAGAGGAITIEFDDVKIDSVQKYGSSGVNLTAIATGTIYVQSIGTYYDGGRVNEDIPCSFQFNLTYDDAESLEEDIAQYGIESILSDAEYENKTHIGAGFGHTTFDGTFSCECWDNIFEGSVTITMQDADLVKYLDQVAHGEDVFDMYDVNVDDELVNSYESYDDALKAAQEYNDGESEVFIERVTFREYRNGDIDAIDQETIWKNFDEYDDDFDDVEY